MMERKAVPTKNQAVNYASTLHCLKAMAQAGTDDSIAVNKAMRAMPVSYFGRPATLHANGRLLYDVALYRVNQPNESRLRWDDYTAVGPLPAAEAFLPMNLACA